MLPRSTILFALATLIGSCLSADFCENENGDRSDEIESFTNGANDVVVVVQSDGTLKATDFHVQIGKFSSWRSLFTSREGLRVEVWVGDNKAPVLMTIGESGVACFGRSEPQFSMTSNELATLDLKRGGNLARYHVPKLNVEVRFIIYLYGQNQRLVVSDIDGTITTSNVRGFIYPQLGIDADHTDVVRLLHSVGDRGYTVMYLTARSMGLDQDTREYLFEDLQNVDGRYSLPFGPLFMSPKSLAASVLEEVTGGPAAQKARTLNSVLSLFDMGSAIVDGAYGNAETDEEAYRRVMISPSRTWIVNEEGVLRNVGDSTRSTYTYQAENVERLYPIVKRN